MIEEIVSNNPSPHPLKELLKRRGIGQAQLALALGISRAYANQILNGIAPVPSQLKERLNCLTEELREVDDE